MKTCFQAKGVVERPLSGPDIVRFVSPVFTCDQNQTSQAIIPNTLCASHGQTVLCYFEPDPYGGHSNVVTELNPV